MLLFNTGTNLAFGRFSLLLATLSFKFYDYSEINPLQGMPLF